MFTVCGNKEGPWHSFATGLLVSLFGFRKKEGIWQLTTTQIL